MKTVLLILAAAAVLVITPQTARGAELRAQSFETVLVQASISSRQARAAAERAYPGARAVDVRYVDGGRPYFVVRMVEGNRRFDVRVDGRTGRVF